MRNEEIIPDYFSLSSEKDLKESVQRREKYSLNRDIQAELENLAIARRLEKDKEEHTAGKTTSFTI